MMYTKDFAPAVLPAHWKKIDPQTFLPPSHPMYDAGDDVAWYAAITGLVVILTVECIPEMDARRWMHVSMSRKDRLPSYDEMCEVKELFVGRDRKAFQIFPAAEHHVNIAQHCLHLWCAVDGDDGFPEFGAGGTI